MKRRRFTTAQIFRIPQGAEAGIKIYGVMSQVRDIGTNIQQPA